MNAPDAADFGPAEESISWAKNDLADFQAVGAKFFTSEKIAIVEEVDEGSGLVYTIMRLFEDIPQSVLKRHAVSALLNTRNSFDQAVNIAGRFITRSGFKRNFPWSASLTDLENHRLKDFPEQLRGPIKLQEPYPRGDGYTGGNDLIRALARLSNNKHSIGFTIDAMGGLDTNSDLIFTGSGHVRRVIFLPPNWDPVKKEVVLFSVDADGVRLELQKHSRLRFDICFEVSELSNPPEVRFALNEFLAAAERNLEFMKVACGK
jgi:hypothetical protein